MPKTNSQITIPQFLNRNLDKNYPIFKHVEVGNETSKNSKDELIKCLTKHIEQLDITLKPSISDTKSINVIIEISNIDKIRSTFEEHDPQINKINHQFKQETKLKNHHPRPTPPYLHCEERNQIKI